MSTVRLGYAGYVAILAALRADPLTTAEMVSAGLLGRTASGRIITSLHHLGVLCIVGWRQNYRSAARPIYGYGSGLDAPAPTERPNGRPGSAAPLRTLVLSSEVVALVALMKALDEPRSKTELMAVTGLSYGGMLRALTALRSHGFARIAVWEHRDCTGGPPMACFAMGSEKDAKRPPRASKRARNQRFTERKRATEPFEALRRALAPSNASVFQLAQCAA